MPQWIDKAQLNQLIPPSSIVYVSASTGEPNGLLDQLQGLSNVHFIQQPLAAVNKRDLSLLGENCSQEVFFVSPYIVDGIKQGRVKFIPMQMRAIFDYLKVAPIDVALLSAAYDLKGELRFGLNLDYIEAAIAGAKTVILEVSDAYLAPLGAPLVGDLADYCFASTSPATLYPAPAVDPISAKIGALVAALIRDGDCLQTGIGAVPTAILAALNDKNDLGLHSGIIDDSAIKLIRAGNMTGMLKPIDQGLHVAGMVFGNEESHAWLAEASKVKLRGADYTHEMSVIKQIDNFVSVNSAVQIDLFGQVNAEVVGGRQISGTGGSVDFMRAAKVSKGGRSIVALSATAKRGQISRIVDKVEMVTALRTDVDLVVTEFGVADLKSKSLRERAEALIKIAHPDFQDLLGRQLRESNV